MGSSLKQSSFSPVHLSLGKRIPDSPHAVSVSLPRFADVIAYEEKEPSTMAKVSSGYPRFVKHPYIVELASVYAKEAKLLAGKKVLFFSSSVALQDALKLYPQFWKTETDGFLGTSLMVVNEGSEEDRVFSNYLQHTGTGLSSREAEDLLIEYSGDRRRYPEAKSMSGGNQALKELLYRWFSPVCKSSIIPCKSGMNAFYASFCAVNELQRMRDRKDWISVGWLYLDTLKILEEYVDEAGKSIWFKDASNTDKIVEYIRENGVSVAGLILEAPTNPLVHTPDIQRISDACLEAGIITIMDPSLVSPQNVDLSPWCDIICCSLTKYAVYQGDVMIGAVSVNLERESGRQLESLLQRTVTLPYYRDLARLGASLEDAASVVEKINRNTMVLAEYFESHPCVDEVYWAYSSAYKDAYRKIHRSEGRPGCIITLKLKECIEGFYDPLPLPKGPSFGTTFTLLCAYIHLAHYDLMETEEGRQTMAEAGIDEKMVRLSVGTEDPQQLIELFDSIIPAE